MVIFFIIFFGGVLNMSIFFVGVDRFIVIKWFFIYYIWFIMKVFVSFVILMWLFMFLFVVLFLVGWGRLDNFILFCMCCFVMILDRIYVVIGYIFIYGLLLIIIVIVYFFILKVFFRYLCVIVV